MQYVLERDGTAVIGPTKWSDELQFATGLRGNKKPPDVPYATVNGTLRNVVREEGSTFSGLVDGVWTVRSPAAPTPVPRSVTPLQARKALRAAGMLDTVNEWMAQQAEEVREIWEYALTIERDNPTLADAATAMGLTEEQMDALFVAASQM